MWRSFAFDSRVRVGHVEAGLRTYDKYSPFPEEMNRKLNIGEDAFAEEAVSCLIIYAKETKEEFHQYEQLCLE